MNRFGLAIRSFWQVLTQPSVAARVVNALDQGPQGPDLRVLAVLQRDGRLVDFLQEEIDGYSDAQIGAAVRGIHKGCRKAIQEYLALEPVLAAPEDSVVTVPPDFDPAEIRVTGNVSGTPPFRGLLKHHGWRVRSVNLPSLPGSRQDIVVLAPAEVEIA